MSAYLYVLETLPVGRILRVNTDDGEISVIADQLGTHPDGIVVDEKENRLYWTNMGKVKEESSLEFFQADGTLESMSLDGSDRQLLVGNGLFVTGKQLTLDPQEQKLYWCDREGMRVFRANKDGSNPEVLVQAGLFPRDSRDYTNHCVGITLDHRNDVFYWTQKGPSKGGKGRILSARLNHKPEDPACRDDVKVLLDNLPEPIDLELSQDGKTLYWTDRGDSSRGGNSLNMAQVIDGELHDHRVIAKGFDETIALAVDEEAKVIYISDLGGTIYKHQLDNPGSVETVVTGLGPLTGITLGRA